MSVSKRLRFEIFKRDGFTCLYCGGRPPDVVLEPDHVIPSSRGGSDRPSNLVTACFACNRGKSAVPLDFVRKPLLDGAAERMERAKQFQAYRRLLRKEKRERDAALEMVQTKWAEIVRQPGTIFEDEHRESVLQFLYQLPLRSVLEAVDIAYRRKRHCYFSYFCGICHQMIYEQREERADVAG